MSKVTDILMNEHRLIEQVITSMTTFAAGVREGDASARQTVGQFVDFLRNFADRCHHGKEEDRLFVAMREVGFSPEHGPVAVMLHEHGEGREHVAVLAAIAAGKGPLGARDRDDLVAHAGGFASLLRSHIQKEDNVLYPMAERALPPDRLDALAEDVERFEREVMRPGEHERLHRLAEELCGRFPAAGDQADLHEGHSC